MTFEDLKSRWTCRPIPDCPGRFVLRDAGHVSPAELVGPGLTLVEYRLDAAPDPVVIVRLDSGGLISYRKQDGTYVHTLNTPDGFARKLRQLNAPDEVAEPGEPGRGRSGIEIS